MAAGRLNRRRMHGFSAGDWAILLSYLGVVFLLGWWKGREERSSEDFVVGGRQIPWWAVLGSIVATEISAITFLNVPGTAFTGDLTYLQFGLGSIAGRFVVAFLFLGAFYRGRHLTVYSYLAERFGHASQWAATGLFLFSRLLASGLRLSLAALGISLIFDLSFLLTLLLFTLLALAYTAWGGIKAIVWTDLVQASVFIGSGVAVAGWLGAELGWGQIWATAEAAGKTRLIHTAGGDAWAWLQEPNLFLLAALNGLLATTAALGTDQDLTQRMLTCRRPRDAQLSVVASGLVGVPVAALFLCLGLGFFALAEQGSAPWLVAAIDGGEIAANRVFPAFIGEGAPHLLRGLLTAGAFAAAMSSIDSAMGALASVFTFDLYRPLIRPRASDRHLLRVNRWAVGGFAAVLFALAWAFGRSGDHLWLALQIASIPAGTLLGLFLLGLTTRRGHDRFNLVAMAVSLTVTSLLFALLKTGFLDLAWTWLILIGMGLTFGLGCLRRPRPGPSPSPSHAPPSHAR